MEIEELRRLSAKAELSLNYIAKDEMVSKLLVSLQVFENIILKGGTAINRVYIKNKRFSEDIDFDFVSVANIKSVVSLTNGIIQKIEDFDISANRVMKNTIRYDLFYINPLSHKDRIMLEFRLVKHAEGFSKRIVNFGFVPYESSLHNVYDIEKIISQKLECILSRIEGKDFFDLYYLLDISHRHLNYLEENKDKIIQRINLSEKELKNVTNVSNHFIPKNKRPVWSLFLEELKDKIMGY